MPRQSLLLRQYILKPNILSKHKNFRTGREGGTYEVEDADGEREGDTCVGRVDDGADVGLDGRGGEEEIYPYGFWFELVGREEGGKNEG